MRKKIIAGNWKMNKLVGEAAELASAVKQGCGTQADVEVVLCPTFTALKTVSDVIAGSSIKLGAQNMHWEKDGAFTGEISAGMLRDLNCQFVILGHSERRQFFSETDATVNRKVMAALAANLTPIVCVGELLEQREANQTEEVVTAQVIKSLAGLDETGFRRTVLAYEPVWAIGTGRTASPAQAQEVHALIRKVLAKMCNPGAAQAVRIQYGGSMKPSNAKELLSQPDIDGGLIGGAALDAKSFMEIVNAAR
jgi:triosephosphate isomerase